MLMNKGEMVSGGKVCPKVLSLAMRYISRCLSQYKELIPELPEFQSKWGIKFPIKPEIAVPINRILTSPLDSPITLCNEQDNKLTLEINLDSHKEIIMAYIENVIDDSLSETKRGQIQEKSLYERYFKVWDLKKGKYTLTR